MWHYTPKVGRQQNCEKNRFEKQSKWHSTIALVKNVTLYPISGPSAKLWEENGYVKPSETLGFLDVLSFHVGSLTILYYTKLCYIFSYYTTGWSFASVTCNTVLRGPIFDFFFFPIWFLVTTHWEVLIFVCTFRLSITCCSQTLDLPKWKFCHMQHFMIKMRHIMTKMSIFLIMCVFKV